VNFEDFPNYTKLNHKNILAIDYGTKETGLASYCPGRDPYPTPYGRIIYKNDKQLIDELEEIINNEAIDVLVLGIPHFLDGKESRMTKKIQSFGVRLERHFHRLEVFRQDETLSSKEAEERMKSSPQYNFKVDPKQIDAVAASIILEDFMRS
jgi:putative holliday junction resolvase